MNDFKDKVVLISGSSRGVGLALARELVKRGALVVINARGIKRLDKAESEYLKDNDPCGLQSREAALGGKN